MTNRAEPFPALPDPSADHLFPPCRQHDAFSYHDIHPFLPGANSMTVAQAAWLADASLLAYEPDEGVVRARFSGAGWSRADMVEGQAVRAWVVSRDDMRWVVFRGTRVYWPGGPAAMSEVLTDWLTDARTTLVPNATGGLVHEGFQAALDQIWPELDRLVMGRGSTRAPRLWLAGHSLGGALATLAASRWGEATAAVYTYGSPMVGDAAFCGTITSPCHRFVHRDDLITKVPVFGWTLALPPVMVAYAHPGTEFRIDAAGHLHQGGQPLPGASDPGAQSPSAQELWRRLGRWAGTALLHDHAPLYYALRMRHQLGWFTPPP